MDSLPRPLAFLLLLVSGWVNRQQQAVIDYLLEENRILRATHAPRRRRLTDNQRRSLADVSGLVTPDTILRWYRKLAAQKYDGSPARKRPVLMAVRSFAPGNPLVHRGVGDVLILEDLAVTTELPEVALVRNDVVLAP
jgi:hypothetical protein